MKRQFLLITLLLGMLTYGCADEKPDTSRSNADTGVPATSAPASPAPSDPLKERAFTELVYKHYAHLATQVSKRKTDSVLKAIKDPSKMNDALQGLMQRQDTLARKALANKYAISIDSVNAIIKNEGINHKGLE